MCETTPRPGCITAPSGKIKSKNNADPSKRQLLWKWGLGTATTGDFGDPVNAGVNYRLCVYDDGVKEVDAAIDAGGTCDGDACWKLKATGRNYKHKTGNAAGISKVKLKAGTGTAKILVKGKGMNLGNPLPFSASTLVTVQFIALAAASRRLGQRARDLSQLRDHPDNANLPKSFKDLNDIDNFAGERVD